MNFSVRRSVCCKLDKNNDNNDGGGDDDSDSDNGKDVASLFGIQNEKTIGYVQMQNDQSEYEF